MAYDSLINATPYLPDDEDNDYDAAPTFAHTKANFLLPVRAEKRITIEHTALANRIVPRHPGYNPYNANFIVMRIPGRGTNEQGIPDGSSAYYRFPINPHNVTVSRTTLDAQSPGKGGWQIGVWGEDFINVRLQGRTGARYQEQAGLAAGTVTLTASYRSLEELEIFFENNGYWFEGEGQWSDQGIAQEFFPHRQIKMVSEVELTVGEFQWTGMFDSLDIEEDASNPYLADFSLSFVAWRERYGSSTPYINPIGPTGLAIEHGHVYTVQNQPVFTASNLIQPKVDLPVLTDQGSLAVIPQPPDPVVPKVQEPDQKPVVPTPASKQGTA